MAEFLGPLVSAEPELEQPDADSIKLGAADIKALLPIRSLGLTPGKVKPRMHAVPFARPFFLIGADAWSKRWLLQHRSLLKDIA